MEVNPASTARLSAIGQSSTGAANPAPDQGPTPKIEPSQKATSRALDGQVGETRVKATDAKDLKNAETLRALISDKNTQLRTYHDEASGHSVLEVSDQATGKVINQYPSDELLRLYAALREPFVDQNA